MKICDYVSSATFKKTGEIMLVFSNYRTNWKADWAAKKDKFNAQYFKLCKKHVLIVPHTIQVSFS